MVEVLIALSPSVADLSPQVPPTLSAEQGANGATSRVLGVTLLGIEPTTCRSQGGALPPNPPTARSQWCHVWSLWCDLVAQPIGDQLSAIPLLSLFLWLKMESAHQIYQEYLSLTMS